MKRLDELLEAARQYLAIDIGDEEFLQCVEFFVENCDGSDLEPFAKLLVQYKEPQL